MKDDDLFNYLVATEQLDDFLGFNTNIEDFETIEEDEILDEENEDDCDVINEEEIEEI